MKRILIIVAIITALVVALAAIVYVFDIRGLRSDFEAWRLRTGLMFLEGTVDARELRQFIATGERSMPLAVEGELIDYVPAAKGFTITHGPDESWNVTTIGHSTVLASGPSPKLWLTVSPDERYLAYAERSPAEATSTPPAAVDIYHPSAWTLRLVDLRSGTAKAVGTGSMPRLFMRDGGIYLLYLLPNEVRIRALDTENEFSLKHAADGLWPAEVSPDGRYLALFNPDRQSYDLSRFTLQDGTVILEPLTLPADELRILAFAGSHLQALAWSRELEMAYLVDIDLEHPSRTRILSERPGLEDVRRLYPAP